MRRSKLDVQRFLSTKCRKSFLSAWPVRLTRAVNFHRAVRLIGDLDEPMSVLDC